MLCEAYNSLQLPPVRHGRADHGLLAHARGPAGTRVCHRQSNDAIPLDGARQEWTHVSLATWALHMTITQPITSDGI